uniref:Uncharacterized protein n=1 Tax=Rangifer tarandus platyrhynchus TaxID=3082113 RepID=A0ACB0DZK6_RANTA|nr:unnamed protein product [Rangifer tarandus platyrhynchus]
MSSLEIPAWVEGPFMQKSKTPQVAVLLPPLRHPFSKRCPNPAGIPWIPRVPSAWVIKYQRLPGHDWIRHKPSFPKPAVLLGEAEADLCPACRGTESLAAEPVSPKAAARPAPSSPRPARVAQTPRLPASGRSSTPGPLPRPSLTDTGAVRRQGSAPQGATTPRPPPPLVPAGQTRSLGVFNFCTNTTQRRVSAFYAARAPETCDSPVESLPFRGEGGLFRRRARDIKGRLPSILSCQLKKLNPRDVQQHVDDQAPGERQGKCGLESLDPNSGSRTHSGSPPF